MGLLLHLAALLPLAAPGTAPGLAPGAAPGLASGAALRQGLEVPANDGWVTDLAGMLEPGQEAALEALMESYKQGSGHEVALLTVPDLGGRTIEELGLAVGRTWKIGREGQNDGAILVIARDDRKLRIEVGRGLEGTLTDSISGRILRDVITPRFKAGRFYDGMREGIEAMHAAAGGDYAKLPRRQGHAPATVLGLLCPLLLVGFFIAILASSRRRGRGGIHPFLMGALLGSTMGRHGGGGFGGGGGLGGGGFGGGGFGGFGGGGGFSGGGASGGW